MTDIARVENIFYEARQYNSSNDSVIATQDEALIYPLVKNANNYQIGLSKASIPLMEIPMRKSNIPLKTYEVALQQGNFTGTAFVRQLNAGNSNYVYILDGLTLNTYVYTQNSVTSSSSIDLSSYVSFIQNFILDDYQNVYIMGSNTNPSIADSIFIVSTEQNVLLETLSFSNIKSIYINGIQQLFVLDEPGTGGICSVYNNNNSGSSVVLTLLGTINKTFADTNLNNCAFVVADLNNIMIGHDSNVITFYDINLVALTDYTLVGASNFSCANVLNGEKSLLIADTTQLPDELIGVQNNELYNVELNQQISPGILDHYAVNVLSNTNPAGLTYIVGTSNHLWYMVNPLSTSGTWIEINTAEVLETISANKFGLYGIAQTSSQFLGWNLDFATTSTNSWQLLSNSLTINSNPITSMDWNIANDRLYAVESTNLYRSNYPVYPINYALLQNGQMTIYGARTNSGLVNNQLLTAQITQANHNNSGMAYSSQTDAYYFIEGNPGSQVITKRDQTDYDFTLVATYNPTQPAGNISAITMCGPYMCVLAGNENIYIYDIDTITLVRQINHLNENIVCLTNVNETNIIAYGVANPAATTNSYITTYNCATGLPLSVKNINEQLTISTIQAITANINDQVNGCSSVFYTYTAQDDFGNNNGYLYKMTYNAGYSSVNQVFELDTSSIATYPQISCNPNLGHLVVVQNTGGASNRAVIYTQANSYSSETVIPTNLTFSGISDSFMVFSNLDKLIQFTQVTTNEPITYVAVSRSNPNNVYIVQNTDNTIYQGLLVSNSITFTQIPEFDTQQYAGLMTKLNQNTINETRLTAISTQTQTELGQIVVSNTYIKSIAKNEITAEFLVGNPTTNIINSYTYNLTPKYQLSSPITPTFIFAKNAEDIDAGNADIFSYAPLINAINLAFEEAYQRLISGNTTPITSAPTISMNYQTGLCTLSYPVGYSQSNNGIYFNKKLWQLIKYNPYVVSTTQDLQGLYKLGLPLNSTSYTQSTSTIWEFNLLNQVAFQSNTLFIANSYFGNNQSNRIVATIDIPTKDLLENNDILYYQPTFMRPYTLSSGSPIDRIQIDVLYSYRDFTVYPLMVSPGQNWRAQFDFIKKY